MSEMSMGVGALVLLGIAILLGLEENIKMSNVIMCIYIGSMAFCAVALGLTILIVGIKTLKDKDNE